MFSTIRYILGIRHEIGNVWQIQMKKWSIFGTVTRSPKFNANKFRAMRILGEGITSFKQ